MLGLGVVLAHNEIVNLKISIMSPLMQKLSVTFGNRP